MVSVYIRMNYLSNWLQWGVYSDCNTGDDILQLGIFHQALSEFREMERMCWGRGGGRGRLTGAAGCQQTCLSAEKHQTTGRMRMCLLFFLFLRVKAAAASRFHSLAL
jgi:hypothetical protein